MIHAQFQPVAEIADDAIVEGTAETDRDEGEIGLDDELRSRDRATALIDLTAFYAGEHPVLADEFEGADLKLANGALGLG